MCLAPPFFEIWPSKSGLSMRCFVHFDFEMCFSLQRRANFARQTFQKWSEHAVFCTFWLENVLLATAACNFSTSQLQKVVRSWCVLYILTWKCASRYSGVQFFDIPASKSGPKLMCFCTFWLQNVLLATAASNFSTSQLQKVVRSWCVFVHFDFKMCFSLQRRAIFLFLL